MTLFLQLLGELSATAGLLCRTGGICIAQGCASCLEAASCNDSLMWASVKDPSEGYRVPPGLTKVSLATPCGSVSPSVHSCFSSSHTGGVSKNTLRCSLFADFCLRVCFLRTQAQLPQGATPSSPTLIASALSPFFPPFLTRARPELGNIAIWSEAYRRDTSRQWFPTFCA